MTTALPPILVSRLDKVLTDNGFDQEHGDYSGAPKALRASSSFVSTSAKEL